MTSDEKPPPTAFGMSVGLELRQAREERGLSLRELSERTKIRQPALRAIESDNLRQLPGGAIGRGFVKMYAREVGLDPQALAERYDAERESAPAWNAGSEPAEGGTLLADLSSRVTPARAAIVIAAIAVLGTGYAVLRPGSGAGRPGEGEAIAVEPSSPAAPATAPVPVAPPPTAPAATPPVKEAVQAPAGEVRVEIAATGDCWIAATADGEQVVYRVLPAGERATLSAGSEAVIRIGMPANVAVTINGQPIVPFERPGSPITLRITPENYRDLVR